MNIKSIRRLYSGQIIAFVSVHSRPGPSLGIAVANERGYVPLPALFATHKEAEDEAERLNRDELCLTQDHAWEIVASSMGGKPFNSERNT